jgi:4-amino-4-deoxy-L-arabinose transferase-like glycosyltransferase
MTPAADHHRLHWSDRWPAGLALVAVGLLAWLPGLFTLPPIDRDESRFAEASRAMIADQHFVVPYVGDEPRLNKPPLIYWLQITGVQATGGPGAGLAEAGNNRIWAYRLPSVVGALLAVLLTWRLGRQLFAPPTPFWGALLLATCTVIAVDVRQARVDQVLLAATVLAQLGLWRVWSSPRTDWLGVAWLWLGITFGVLIKGPVTPAVVVLTACALAVATRRFRWLLRTQPWAGVIIASAPIGLWGVLVAQEIGWSPLAENLRHELWTRSTTALESHQGFPGYHTLLLVVLFWPGVLALAPGACSAWRRGLRGLPRRFRRPELFLVAWIVPTWLLFELVSTRLPHYTLPTYPAIALLCARGLLARRMWQWVERWSFTNGLLGGYVVLTAALTLVAPLVLAWFGRLQTTASVVVPLIALLLLAAGLVILLARAVGRREMQTAQRFALASAVTGWITVFAVVLPHTPAYWLSPRAAAALRAHAAPGQPLAAAGYHEASLRFLTNNRVEFVEWAAAARWLRAHPDGLLLAPDNPIFHLGPTETLAEFGGVNYSSGEWITLRLLRPLPE